MKKRLNIFCIAVFLVLAFSFYMSGYQFGKGVKLGLTVGEQQAPKLKEQQKMMFWNDFRIVDLVPVEAMWNPDTLVNAKTKEETPVIYTQMMVELSKDRNLPHFVVHIVCSLLYLILTLSALIVFALLIASINKSRIFEWRNVKRLRWLGALLIVSFICNQLPKVISYWGIGELFELQKYMVAPLSLQVTDLLLGLGCLIVAETFAIGLKMREEQELTI